MNRLPKGLNERNINNLTTSKKTLEGELFPSFEVRTKQVLRQSWCVYICECYCTGVQ